MRWIGVFAVVLFLFVSLFSLSVRAQEEPLCVITNPDTAVSQEEFDVVITFRATGGYNTFDFRASSIQGSEYSGEVRTLDPNFENDGTATVREVYDDIPPGANVQFVVRQVGVVDGGEIFCASESTTRVLENPDIGEDEQLPVTPLPEAGQQYVDITFDPPLEYADGLTRSSTITFHGLNPGKTYKACFRTDGECRTNGGEDDFVTELGQGEGSTTIEFSNLCGDGEERLKQADDECDPMSDYFHEGRWYGVHLFTEDGEETPAPNSPAIFYVRHTYPRIVIDNKFAVQAHGEDLRAIAEVPGRGGVYEPVRESEERVEIGNPFGVVIEDRLKPGGARRNNYQLVLEGRDVQYKDADRHCVALQGDTRERGSTEVSVDVGTFDYLYAQGAPLPSGTYVLKVNEQINEKLLKELVDDCQGGFTYYHIPIIVEFDEEGNRRTYVDVDEIEVDPNESDKGRESEIFPSPPPPPCDPEFYDEDSKKCTGVPTALFGTISTDPAGFIGDIFGWVIGIAGLGALALLLYSGYLIMFSQGDQEKIQQARENIKSVVIGLLFVVFSIVILEILGVDILGIPGLGR